MAEGQKKENWSTEQVKGPGDCRRFRRIFRSSLVTSGELAGEVAMERMKGMAT